MIENIVSFDFSKAFFVFCDADNQYTGLDLSVDSVTRHTLAKMNTWTLLSLLI